MLLCYYIIMKRLSIKLFSNVFYCIKCDVLSKGCASSSLSHKVHEKDPMYYYVPDNIQYKTGTKFATRSLETLLDMSAFEAFQHVKATPLFAVTSYMVMKKNMIKLLEAGILKATIIDYPTLLIATSLNEKLKLLTVLKGEINDVAPLINVSLDKLQETVRYMLRSNNSDRIITFTSRLEVSPQKLCEFIIQKPFLLKMSTKKFNENMDLLEEYGVPKSHICNDLWILMYRADKIEAKFKQAKNENVDSCKTWMVRCSNDIFSRHTQIVSQEKQILGDNSLKEYLSEKLNCKEEEVMLILDRMSPLNGRSVKKMEEIINFLYAQGFKPEHIRRMPKILVHAIGTIKTRLAEFKKHNIPLNGLSVLTKSKKQYMENFESRVRTQQKQDKKKQMESNSVI